MAIFSHSLFVHIYIRLTHVHTQTVSHEQPGEAPSFPTPTLSDGFQKIQLSSGVVGEEEKKNSSRETFL